MNNDVDFVVMGQSRNLGHVITQRTNGTRVEKTGTVVPPINSRGFE